MKPLYTFLALLLPVLAWTQSSTPEMNPLDHGKVHHLLADKVNVRDQPSTKGKVVANLPIGTPVEVVEDAGTLTLRGFSASWYRVKFDRDGTETEGYVWGGLIAENTFVSAQDPELRFHYGIDHVEGEREYPIVYMQVRAEKGLRELSRAEFERIGETGTTTWAKSLGDRGVAGVDEVLQIDFSAEMCGGAFGQVILFRQGDALRHVINLYDGADAPVWSDQSLIFPADSLGRPGRLVWTFTFGEETEEGEMIEEGNEVIYTWDGKALVKEDED